VSPLSARQVQSTLRKYGITPSKRRGQSFLTDSGIARRIVKAAKLGPTDSVLEIGGGLGILTKPIAEEAGKVYVVEIDPLLVTALQDAMAGTPNVQIIHGDALRVPLPMANKCVSNLPYSISSDMTFRLWNELDLDMAVLMYQREYAQRLLAEPGSSEYSRLTVDINYRATVEKVMHVPATMFYPVPAVDSVVVKMTPRVQGSFAEDRSLFLQMVNGIYPYPNKHLRRALGIWLENLGLSKDLSEAAILRMRKKLTGEEKLRCLPLEDLIALADSLLGMINDGILPDIRRKTSERLGP